MKKILNPDLEEIKKRLIDLLKDNSIDHYDLFDILIECDVNKTISKHISKYVKINNYEKAVDEIIDLILQNKINKDDLQLILDNYDNDCDFEYCPYCDNYLDGNTECLICGYTIC